MSTEAETGAIGLAVATDKANGDAHTNSEKEKLEEWLTSEQEKGLIYMSFVAGSSARGATKEQFAAENNYLNHLITQGNTVKRDDVF